MVWNAPYELRKLSVNWLRAQGETPPQDVAMCTFHFLNLTDGTPDASWITSDYTQVEGAFNAFWAAIDDHYDSSTKLGDYVWRADGPAFRPHGSSLSPTLRIAASSGTAGLLTGEYLPPQVAITVTEVTPAKYTVENVEGVGTQQRNRWGRFYLPSPSALDVVAGRLASSAAETIAVAAQTFYNACVAADHIPVVYSPTTGSSWAVDEIHVDDIFDVIRSRRYVTPLSRHAKTITAP